MKWLAILVAMALTARCPAQDLAADLRTIGSASTQSSKPSQRPEYAFKGRSWWVKYNPLSLLAGGALLAYQSFISPQIMQGCAFNPSCSNFSRQSVKRFGLVKGLALSADRLTRCTRLSSIDFHPVLIENGKVHDPVTFYDRRK